MRKATQSKRFNFKFVRVCGLSGPRAMNIASKVRFKVYEVHATDKIKTVLFEVAIKTRSTILVFFE